MDENTGGFRGMPTPEGPGRCEHQRGSRGCKHLRVLRDADTGGAQGWLPSPEDAAQQLDPLLFPPKCVHKALLSHPQCRQGGQDQHRGWSWGLPCPQPGSLMPNGTCNPPEQGLGCAPVPTQGGGATGGRDPMGFWRKASLCSTFPSFYGVVLFMAREGNEQLARRVRQTQWSSALAGGTNGGLLPSDIP